MKHQLFTLIIILLTAELFSQSFEFRKEKYIIENKLGQLGFFKTDIDQDGQYEFITDALDKGIVMMGTIENNEIISLQQTTSSIFSQDIKDLRLEDTNGDGYRELYILQDSKGLIRLDTGTLEGIDTFPAFPISPVFKRMILADSDLDTINEWIMLDGWDSIKAFNLVDYSIKWTIGASGVLDMRIGQLDEDAEQEIVLLKSNSLDILNLATFELEHSIPTSFYDLDLVDLNQDGIMEVLLKDLSNIEIYDHVQQTITDSFSTSPYSLEDHYTRNLDEDPELEIILYSDYFGRFFELNTYPLALLDQYELRNHVAPGQYSGYTGKDSNELIFLPNTGLNLYDFEERENHFTTNTGLVSAAFSSNLAGQPGEYFINRNSYLTVKSLPEYNSIQTITGPDLFEGHLGGFGERVFPFRRRGIDIHEFVVNNSESFSIYDLLNNRHQEFYDIPGWNLTAADLDHDGGDELIFFTPTGLNAYKDSGFNKFEFLFSSAPSPYAPLLEVGQLNATPELEIVAGNFQTIQVLNGLTGSLLHEITQIPDAIILDINTFTDSQGNFYIGVLHGGTYYIYNYTSEKVETSFSVPSFSGSKSEIVQVVEGNILETYIVVQSDNLTVYNTSGNLIYTGEPSSGRASGNIIISDYDADFKPNIITSASNKYTEYKYAGTGERVSSFYITHLFPKDTVVLNNPTSFSLQFSEQVDLATVEENMFLQSTQSGILEFDAIIADGHRLIITPVVEPASTDTLTLSIHGGLQSIYQRRLDTNNDGINLGQAEPPTLATYIFESSSIVHEVVVSINQTAPTTLFQNSRRTLPIKVHISDQDIESPIAFLETGIAGEGSVYQVQPVDSIFDEATEYFNVPVNTFGLNVGFYRAFIIAGDHAGIFSDTFFHHFEVIAENGAYDKNAGADAWRSGHLANTQVTSSFNKLYSIPKTNSERPEHIVGGDGYFYYLEDQITVDSVALFKHNLFTGEEIWERKIARHFLNGSPHLDRGLIYFTNRPGSEFTEQIYAIDILTGEQVWSEPYYSGFEPASSPVTNDDLVLAVGGERGSILAFDRWTGKPYWYSKRLNAEFGEGAPSLFADAAYMIEHTTMKSVDLNTGEINWVSEITDDEPPFIYTDNPVIDTLNKQLIYPGDLYLHFFDVETGERKFRVPGGGSFQNPIVYQNYVFLFKSNSISRYEASTGKLLQQKMLSANIINPPLAANGKLFVPLNDRFEIIDMFSLQTIWSLPLDIMDVSIIDQYLLLTDTGYDIHVYESQPGCCRPGITWTETIFDFFGNAWTRRYTFDTIPIINNGQTYFEALYSDSETGNFWHRQYQYFRGDENGIYELINDIEYQLIDFNLEIGDTLAYIPMIVTDIDTIILDNGESKKRLLLNCDEWGDYPIYFIKDIGSTTGLINFYSTCATDAGHLLLCHWQDDVRLYHDPNQITCWLQSVSVEDIDEFSIQSGPNPFSDEIHIEDPDHQLTSIQIMDMLGNVLYQGNDLLIRTNHYSFGCYNILFQLKNGKQYTQRIVKVKS